MSGNPAKPYEEPLFSASAEAGRSTSRPRLRKATMRAPQAGASTNSCSPRRSVTSGPADRGTSNLAGIRSSTERFVGDHLDLDLDIEHESDRENRPHRRVLAEIAAVEFVEAYEVARIGQPDLTIHDVTKRATGNAKRLADHGHRQMHLLIERNIFSAGSVVQYFTVRVENDVHRIERPRTVSGREHEITRPDSLADRHFGMGWVGLLHGS